MTNLPTNTRVMIGLSGGVDSAVAALLLKEQGYQLQAVFMQNWEADNDDPYCTATQDLSDARAVCETLQIPLQTVNFAKDYWERVFQYFLDEYAQGRTPNPDILCNTEIKFNAFLAFALAQNADYIATGHYVKCQQDGTEHRLIKAKDTHKDQSYFLHGLNQYQLAHSLFPLGNLTKPEVRKIAKDAGLINYQKKDSTGICFIGERRFSSFLKEYLLTQPGAIVTQAGDTIGKHEGLMFYTLGQRKGLHIGGQPNHAELPWYVADKDIANNRLIVVQGHQHPALFRQHLHCKTLHWIGTPSALPLHCTAKTRYRQNDAPCIVEKETTGYSIVFKAPQFAITPGQFIVLYQGDHCLGGGAIA